MAGLNLNDPRPPYVQIADELRKTIKSGQMAPGTQIASVRELAEQYDVSHTTVGHAIRRLRNEGLLVSWQGRGVFVRDPNAESQAQLSPEQTLAVVMERLEEMYDGMQAIQKRLTQLEQAGTADTPALPPDDSEQPASSSARPRGRGSRSVSK